MDDKPVTLIDSIERLLDTTQADIRASNKPAMQMYSQSGPDFSYVAGHIEVLGQKGRIMFMHVVNSQLLDEHTIGVHAHGNDGSSEMLLMDNPFRQEPLHGYLLDMVAGMLERIL